MTFEAQGNLDWKDYTSWFLNYNKYVRFIYMALWSAFSAHAILRVFLKEDGFPSIQWMLLALILFGALFSLTFFLYVWKVKKNPGSFERVTCRIMEQGILHEQEHQTWRVKWEQIEKVIVTNQHIFLILDIQNPLIVPKRFFTERQAMEAVGYIQSRAGKISEEQRTAIEGSTRYTVTGKLKVHEYYAFHLARSKRLLFLALALSALATSFWEFPGYIIWIYRWVLLRNWAIYFWRVLPLVYVPFLLLQTVRLWKAKPLREKVYLFTEDELFVKAEETQQRFSWSSIRKVKASRWALTIFFSGNAPAFLPLRYFSDRQEQKTVAAFIREKAVQVKGKLRSA